MMYKNSITLILEGNTGAGKTSLCNLLEKELNATIIKEPLERWRNVKNKGNIFDMYKNNRKRWAFTFQSYAFFTFLQTCMETQQDNGIYIFDRSMYSGLLCFARLFKAENTMTDIEYEMFQEMHSWIAEKITFKPDGFLYLNTPAQQCYDRAKQRNRPEEKSLSIEFFNHLNKYHEDWFTHKENTIKSLNNVPVLTIDGTQNYVENYDVRKRIVKNVKNFILELSYEHQKGYEHSLGINRI